MNNAIMSTTSTPEGRAHAKEFFDLCDTDPLLRKAVSYANGSIVQLAASHHKDFTYADMQAHLKERWNVQGEVPMDFCCT